jgi:CDP-6-deoxy-D-xylo-4-hexulose-3-dehydrase
MQIFLEKKGIQTRTIFTGNILRQPIMKKKKYKKVKNCSLNSNNIMKNGILIGCHQGLREVEISYMFKNINLFLKKYKLI